MYGVKEGLARPFGCPGAEGNACAFSYIHSRKFDCRVCAALTLFGLAFGLFSEFALVFCDGDANKVLCGSRTLFKRHAFVVYYLPLSELIARSFFDCVEHVSLRMLTSHSFSSNDTVIPACTHLI